MSGLYIHVPFCRRKCDYCAFYSEVSSDWKIFQRFFQTLEKEIRNLPAEFSPQTVFIGGGTPTAPDFQTLEKFFSAFAKAMADRPIFGKFSPAEFSVEANPGTVDERKISQLINCGVNRLSIGVQSFNSHCLETLGRIHSAQHAEAAFRMARAAGFDNISIDLMFGTPGQTLQMLDADLDRALALDPEHIAIYNLMYEEGTPLTERNPVRLDEALEREMYDRIRARLKAAGFVHYEISNFAKPGFECKHNLLYWTGGEYIGCGPSAHSHWQGTRWANVADLESYCSSGGSPGVPAITPARALPKDATLSGRARPPGEPLNGIAYQPIAAPPEVSPHLMDPELSGRASLPERAEVWPPREFEETLDPEAKARETLVMGLRLTQGVEVSSNHWKKWEESFQTLEKQGLLIIEGHHVRLTEEALFISDSVFAELV